MQSEPPPSLLNTRKLLLLGLVALVVAALMNADSLLRDAESKPFGRKRDVSVAVWEPVQQVSDALYLNRPRMWLDDLRDREFSDPTDVAEASPISNSSSDGSVTSTSAPTTTSASTTSVPPGTDPTEPVETTTPVETTAPAETTTPAETTISAGPSTTTVPPAPRLPVPTGEEPLELWVGGDSMAAVFGNSLVRAAQETGIITAESEATLSSGLARPDYLDWPARLSEIAETQDPDVLVLILGANDVQGMVTADGTIVQPDEPEWEAEYRLRVRDSMSRVADEGRLVVWVGQPIMRSESLSSDMRKLNAIYASEAAANDDVEFLESWDLFVDGDGNYTDLLELADGNVVDLRLNDGVHLTANGGLRLAEQVLAIIDSEIEASK